MVKLIEKLLRDYNPNHTQYQIDNFIVGASGDEWAQYKQCLREIAGRYDGLISKKEDLELIDSHDCKHGLFNFGKHKKIKAKIEAARMARRRLTILNSIKHSERELRRFVDLAIELKEKIGEIDDAKRSDMEANSWFQKARRKAALEIYCYGRPSEKTIEFILSLPREQRRAALGELKQYVQGGLTPAKVLEIE